MRRWRTVAQQTFHRSLRTSSFPAYFVRGGTSNGLVIDRAALPKDLAAWQPILSSAMGSPDPCGRQLNGMGSGISSTSKICVIQRSARSGIDIDFTFVQVGIKDGSLDMAGNCGNMSAAVGPIAWDSGMVDQDRLQGGFVTARVWNTNTSKEMHETFSIDERSKQFQADGDYSIDGVPGTASKITIAFLNPAGAKTGKAFPTGTKIDRLELGAGDTIEATLSDIANPGVFIRAADVGVRGDQTAESINSDSALMARLEDIRREGTRMMGLDPNVQSVPKIVMLASPTPKQTRDGINIVCRALSMQQAHKAVPLTLGLNLGVIARLSGTIAYDLAEDIGVKDSVVIEHASGKVEIGSTIKDGQVANAQLLRTMRVLMRGDVFYTLPD